MQPSTIRGIEVFSRNTSESLLREQEICPFAAPRNEVLGVFAPNTQEELPEAKSPDEALSGIGGNSLKTLDVHSLRIHPIMRHESELAAAESGQV